MNKSAKDVQKDSNFRAKRGNLRFLDRFLRFLFKAYRVPLFPLFSPSHPSPPCLKPSHPSLPHASSPCLKPSPSSSPCLKPMPSPCLKRMPQAHASLPQPSPSSMLQAQAPLPSMIYSILVIQALPLAHKSSPLDSSHPIQTIQSRPCPWHIWAKRAMRAMDIHKYLQ